jgi:hypothetical protein
VEFRWRRKQDRFAAFSYIESSGNVDRGAHVVLDVSRRRVFHMVDDVFQRIGIGVHESVVCDLTADCNRSHSGLQLRSRRVIHLFVLPAGIPLKKRPL